MPTPPTPVVGGGVDGGDDGLDSGGRRILATTTSASGTSTLERHYTDGSDNPAWTVSSTAGTTRYAESLGGDLSVTIGADGAATLPLPTLHGDVVTTVAIPAAQSTGTACTTITGWSDYSEYGTPRDAAGLAAVAGSVGYGWLGAKQRSTTPETAGLTLMGDRLYNSATGRFTSLDPEPGGNDNAYTYPIDPVNKRDLNGHQQYIGIGSGGGGLGAIPMTAAIIGVSVYYLVYIRGIAIPFPSVNSSTAIKYGDVQYYVYGIYNLAHQVYKFGITRVGGGRPQSQISKCGSDRSHGWRADEGCYWHYVALPIGFFAARSQEAGLIANYVRVHGHCPPGQYYSCM